MMTVQKLTHSILKSADDHLCLQIVDFLLRGRVGQERSTQHFQTEPIPIEQQ